MALALADEDDEVQTVATHVLGRIRDADGGAPGLDHLVVALNSELWQVRAAAARALGRSGSMRAVEPLRETLRSGDTGVAMAAVVGVEEEEGGRIRESSNMRSGSLCEIKYQ